MREPSPLIQTPRQRSLAAGGFSLLEVLVALVLVAIVLISVYRLYSQSILMDRRARFDTVAPQLARLKLAELERAWQEAEEIAGISDSLLLPPSMLEKLRALRR